MPAPAESRWAGALLAGVDADLDRGRAAHHHPAPGAGAVEELLHGRITRRVQDAPWRPDGVHSLASQEQAGRAGLEADAVGAPLGVTLRERRPGQVSRSLAARGHQIAPSVSVVGLARPSESTRRF